MKLIIICRSLSEFEPLDKIKKLNMKKILQETPKKQVKTEAIDRNLYGSPKKEEELVSLFDSKKCITVITLKHLH